MTKPKAGFGSPESGEAEKVRILLVEGDAALAATVAEAARDPALELVRAESGEQALRLLRADRDFGLVLLDVSLPGMDAFETARRIRDLPSPEPVPFLLIGARTPDEAQWARSHESGAADFFFPPSPLHVLRSKIRVFAELHRKTCLVGRLTAQLEGAALETAERLQGSEERFRLMVENIRDYAIFMVDLEGRITSWNPGVQRIFGYPEEEFVGRSGSLIFTPEDVRNGAMEAELKSALENGTAADERWHLRKDGSRFWASGLLTSMRDGRGAKVGLVKILRDFTERRLARESLERSEERYRWLVENTTETIWRVLLRQPVSRALPAEELVSVFFEHAYLVECNEVMARLHGYGSAAEMLGLPLARILDPGIPANRELLRSFIESGFRLLDAESVEKGKSGELRYVRNNLVGEMDAGSLAGAWATGRDITDRKRAELDLRQSREQLSVILKHIADAIFVYDAGGRLVFLNDAAARVLELPSADAALGTAEGAPEAARLLTNIEVRDETGNRLPPERLPSRLALGGRTVPPTVLRYRLPKQGTEKWVVAQANPIPDDQGGIRMVVTILQDVTELRKAEEQFRHAQKMEAVGRLAGGVAHDFNNLLTAIIGYCDLLLDKTDEGDVRRGHLQEIRKAGMRAASLTNQLLAYGRKQVLSPKVLDPNAVLSGMEDLLRRLIGENIRLTTQLDPGVGRIRADKGQVEQVMLNLVVNARDAMPGGGNLRILSANEEVGEDSPAIDPALPPGRYACISVSDTGIGMDEDVKTRLFEPFFTTKKPGLSSGLGLSTAYGIAKQSGGTITVQSEPGKGATFKVFFPLTDVKERQTDPA